MYMADIKEEIIEFNPKLGIITRYCVIIEQAQRTLSDLLKLWTMKEESDKRREWFSVEKLTFYFYQAMCAIAFCH